MQSTKRGDFHFIYYKRHYKTKAQKKSCAYLSSGAQDPLFTRQAGAQCFFGVDYGSKDLDELLDFSELKLGYLERLCWKKNHYIRLKKEWPLSLRATCSLRLLLIMNTLIYIHFQK